MLTLMLPDSCRAERSWIVAVVLQDFLGLSTTLHFDHEDSVRICAAGKTLTVADTFFRGAQKHWLTPQSLPSGRLQQWMVSDSVLTPELVRCALPVLFGDAGFVVHASGDATLQLDIFGSAFFMLSRYEEAVLGDRDVHDRFPASASLAQREGFLDRPIVDEYVEILWAALHRLWPHLTRKPRTARMRVSCDVDSPFDPACTSLPRLGKRLLGQTWRDKSPVQAIHAITNYVKGRTGDVSRDPYWSALDWIMTVNEQASNQVAFYVIAWQTDVERDSGGGLHDPRMQRLLHTMHARGHEIGIHPGYYTHQHPVAFARSVERLREVMDEQDIRQEVIGGRQHYLRWNAMATPQLWEAHGLHYDATLTYAERPGFRCGTSHAYRMYSLAERRPLRLLQQPLVVMEGSVVDDLYMGLGYGEAALEVMQRYKKICHQFGGDFTLLWHNSCLQDERARHMYCEIIKW